MAAQLYKTTTGRLFHAGEIAIITVGLPARGKTYLAHKLSRYLRWLGVRTSIFSVGDYRRRIVGNVHSDYFTSSETASVRQSVADLALDDLIQWFKSGGQVGIYDASNTEESRRDYLYERLVQHKVQVLFIESICDREDLLHANIREMESSSPDYMESGMAPGEILEDFKKRIDGFLASYAPIKDRAFPFIQDINAGERIIANHVQGYLQTRVVYFLMNLVHIAPRRIYLSRNGESVNEKFLRSDAPLSPKGESYSALLPALLADIRHEQKLSHSLRVWTSPRRRSYGSAVYFPDFYYGGSYSMRQKSSLVEMNVGAIDGMSENEIKSKYPEEYERHQQEPYTHRYPRAESYHDLAIRLEDILLELERERDDVLIIAHPTVLRCIYAYLTDIDESRIPSIVIPEETVIELVPTAYGCKECRYNIRERADSKERSLEDVE